MRQLIVLALALSLSACATTTKVAVRQPGDSRLTCEQIKAEFEKLDNVQQEADDNRGVNTTNVAAAVLFWPAIISTYMSASDAEKALNRRREVLMDLNDEKDC